MSLNLLKDFDVVGKKKIQKSFEHALNFSLQLRWPNFTDGSPVVLPFDALVPWSTNFL